MDITKRQLNKIKSNAYETFVNQYTAEELKRIFCCVDIITVWRIEEGRNVKHIITQYDSQINSNTLNKIGFTADAEITKLFYVNRKTKCVQFVNKF